MCARLGGAAFSRRKTSLAGERYSHDRIRIAYVSADFREHAASMLMAGMF